MARIAGSIAAATIAGFIAGLAAGTIDALWSWDALGQFVGGLGKVRALLYSATSYALAAALFAPLLTFASHAVARTTRLGDALSALGRVHRDAPLARLSIAITIVPSVALSLGVAWLAAHGSLASRNHFGLVIAVAMAAAVTALILGGLLGLLLARLLESALSALGPRSARAGSRPTAALIGLGASIGGSLAVLAWRSWETISLLRLRPAVVIVVILVLTLALRGPAVALAHRLSARGLFGRTAIAISVGLTLAAMLQLGSNSGVLKATTTQTGLGGALTRVARTVFDLDRDGYSRVLEGGDCDDWDSSVNPGAAEIPQDRIDNNCVGGDVVLDRSVDEVAFAEVPMTVPADFNVILITIDTVRADHLGAYGYKRATSPALDALAADGTLFANAWAHAPSTRYSIPAILTGRLPLSVDYTPIKGAWPGLAPENVTIAEVLKQRGFATAAILNYRYFEERREMNQGFDHYDNKNRILHQGVKGKGPAQTKGSSSKQQTDKAIAYLDARPPERRFFLWVHYYDPHYAYERHPGTTDFGDDRVALYDHEIRYTDDQIGRLLTELRQRGLYETTVVVVTGDHGEGFGEHGVSLHGYHLYSAQTKIPLIIRVPGVAPAKITTPVAHVDILPTLANLAGASATTEMDGRSMLDAITGTADPNSDRIVYQQLSYENNNEMRAAASKKCHVIFNVSPHRSWETYELDRDPYEKRDKSGSEACADVRFSLEAFYDRSEIPRDAISALVPTIPVNSGERVDVSFGDGATLVTLDLPAEVKRGQSVPLRFTWETGKGFDEAWSVFVHLEGTGTATSGFIQADHKPARPTTWWRDGQVIHYQRYLRVPKSARPGRYKVWLGLFRDKERHPVSMSGTGDPLPDDRAEVGSISVVK